MIIPIHDLMYDRKVKRSLKRRVAKVSCFLILSSLFFLSIPTTNTTRLFSLAWTKNSSVIEQLVFFGCDLEGYFVDSSRFEKPP